MSFQFFISKPWACKVAALIRDWSLHVGTTFCEAVLVSGSGVLGPMRGQRLLALVTEPLLSLRTHAPHTVVLLAAGCKGPEKSRYLGLGELRRWHYIRIWLYSAATGETGEMAKSGKRRFRSPRDVSFPLCSAIQRPLVQHI